MIEHASALSPNVARHGRLVRVEELATMDRAEAERVIRDAVQNVYLGDHIALTRILGFHKFFLDTRDVGFGGHLLLDGYWEMWLTLFCARNVRPGMTAIDVGANLGYYTILFGNNVGPNGSVIAVEPNPRAVDLLRKSVEINGYSSRTRIEQVACADAASTSARLAVPETEPKNAHVLAAGAPADCSALAIGCVTLDALCAGSDSIDFIKIDAEGSEERIFSGMAAMLATYKPTIVMEVNVARYADPAAFVRRLSRVYGKLRYVTYDGRAALTTEEELLTRDVGHDWLIVLSPNEPL